MTKPGRIFIVGVARSGTTLLQSYVGAHPDILTFPETHFFDYNFPEEFWKKPFALIGPQNQRIVNQIESKIGMPESLRSLRTKLSGEEAFVSSFVEKLDRWASSEQKSVWLEKTPIHVRYLDKIQKYLAGAVVIHSIRTPIDNIASLVRVSRKYPGQFYHSELKKAIQRYKRDIKKSAKFIGSPNHLFVNYEDFSKNSSELTGKIWNILGLDQSGNQQSYLEISEKITNEQEDWKKKNTREVEFQSGNFEGLEPSEIDQLKEKEAALKKLFNQFDPVFLK